jgi:flagellin-like hook-associated protein FlgL
MQTTVNYGKTLIVSDGGDAPPLEDIKVDADSARMLHRLRRAWDADNEDGYLTSSQLQQATELDNTTSVNYRMDTHLIPGELAAERYQSGASGEGDQPRQYVIQQRGIAWLDNHPDPPLPPAEQISQLRADLDQAIEEINATARAAQAAADSADEQVEALNGKIGGLKSRLTDLADRLEAAEATIADTHQAASNQATVLDDHGDRLGKLADGADDRDDRLEDHGDRLDELSSSLSDWSDYVDSIVDKHNVQLSAHSTRLDKLTDDANDRDDRLDAIAERQDEILDRLDQLETPWWRRITNLGII